MDGKQEAKVYRQPKINGWVIFRKEFVPINAENHKEKMSQAGKAWKALPKTEQQRYNEIGIQASLSADPVEVKPKKKQAKSAGKKSKFANVEVEFGSSDSDDESKKLSKPTGKAIKRKAEVASEKVARGDEEQPAKSKKTKVGIKIVKNIAAEKKKVSKLANVEVDSGSSDSDDESKKPSKPTGKAIKRKAEVASEKVASGDVDGSKSKKSKAQIKVVKKKTATKKKENKTPNIEYLDDSFPQVVGSSTGSDVDDFSTSSGLEFDSKSPPKVGKTTC